MARLYGDLATGGQRLGIGEPTLRALIEPARLPTGGAQDLVLKVPTRYSLGYLKPFPQMRFGSSADQAFGTPGAGGSFGFADPDRELAFAYVMNRMGFHLHDDPREKALRDAVIACID